jgi:hypothetical protein
MGSAGIAPPFLTSPLVGGEWSDSRTGRFTHRERSLGIHWIGGWVGPRAGPDDVVKPQSMFFLLFFFIILRPKILEELNLGNEKIML